ncbi:hypothetical protein CALCODRAFT_513922 [Calocera cornea HHB12733]|uniref:Uncharacterized protein n=1 Tax=Calocera cornea HHB12733 TaxID=1353952 RepID=A0A165K4A0_9BASI|nr:hypothetical protein CALCODRAFT_513922 [Calocera cornea HHB12733]
MALTMTALRTPPSPSHLPYTIAPIAPRKSYRSIPPAPLGQPSAQKYLDLDLSGLSAALTTAHTPPLSSASTSSSSSTGTPPTDSLVKRSSRIIQFGTGLPSSPLTRRSMAGLQHKRTLSFSATLLHRPSVASMSSFEGEGREEQFHASFPLPPGVEIGDETFSYAHARRASLPISDRGSWSQHMDDFSKLLDEVMPSTSPGRISPSDYPPPPERFRSRRSAYPESCHSIAGSLSSRPSRDDLHAKPFNRDTTMSLPFVWADGTPLQRQPTNASTHRPAGGLKREKSAYAPFPESPKAFSPTASEFEMYPFSDAKSISSPSSKISTPSPTRRRGRSTKRSSTKNLSIATRVEPMPLTLKMEIDTILEADPQADEQPSPVPSSVFLPDSQWPTPVLVPMQLPVEDMTPLQLDGAFEASQDKVPLIQSVEEMDMDEVLRNMEIIMRVTEELDLKYTTFDEKPSARSTKSCAVAEQYGPKMESTKPLRLPNKPLKVNKELPLPPAAMVELKNAIDSNPIQSLQGVLKGKRSTNDLWRTMVSNPMSPVQPKQEQIKQAAQPRSAQSSPRPLPSPPRTPSPVKRSASRSMLRTPSPIQLSPPCSIRSPSPAKITPPPRPIRSPSPLILEDLEFLEQIDFDLRSAPPSPTPSPFGMRSSPNVLTTHARRDSIDSFMSTDYDSHHGAEPPSFLRIPHQQFAQQIPSKAARKLGVSEDVVMVLNRSPSRSSNFSDHNRPASPKPKKKPFGSLFGSAHKKGAKAKLEISLPMAGPVEPVVLYTPSLKSPTPSYPIHHEQGFFARASSPLFAPHTTGRATSPAAASMRTSPNNASHFRAARDRSTAQQWI